MKQSSVDMQQQQQAPSRFDGLAELKSILAKGKPVERTLTHKSWISGPKCSKIKWFLRDVAQHYGLTLKMESDTTWFSEKVWYELSGKETSIKSAMSAITNTLKKMDSEAVS